MNEIEKTNTRTRSFELVLCWLNDFTPQYAESLYISPINIVTPNVSSPTYGHIPSLVQALVQTPLSVPGSGT